MKEYKKILSDLPRRGSPGHLTEVDIALLQTLACESPGKYGLPVTDWTHELLSGQAKKKGITISPAHYGRLLKKNELKPHKSENWLFPKIENEEEFKCRIGKICNTHILAQMNADKITVR